MKARVKAEPAAAPVERTALEKRIESVTRTPALKAIVISDDGRTRTVSNVIDEEKARSAFVAGGAIIPPYNLSTLCEIFECSSALRPSVDAYATNIDGNGHHLEAVINLDADDLIDQLTRAIYVERLTAKSLGQVVVETVPTLEEVEARLQTIQDEMHVERFRLEQFFAGCTIEESFISLRKRTRQDLEVTGNGFWEVLRDSADRVVQFVYVAAHTVRLLAQGREYVEVVTPVRASPISVRQEKLRRRFRRFIQVVDGVTMYFKEYGDPRVMSSYTGKIYATVDALKKAEPARGERGAATPATELFHFKIHAPRTPYGVPRWIGALLNVLGIRQAEEVNFLYFENKSVPPLALLVSGGRVTADSVNHIRDFIDNEIKGTKNFHKILVIEAESGGDQNTGDPLASGRLKIELKPLTSAQHNDALFQKYDERSIDKVGMQFRLSRMLRGDIRDFNRATADAALEFAEAQVFGPERVEFDHFMNKIILDSLGVRFWKFASNATIVRDPKVLADIIAKLTQSNVLVPNDARRLAAELVFASPLPKIDADWVMQPVMLSQVGIALDGTRDGKIPGLDESTAPAGPGQAAAGATGAVAPQKGGRVDRVLAWASAVRSGTSKQRALVDLAGSIIGLRDELVKLEEELATADHAEGVADEKAAEAKKASPAAPAEELPTERITMPLDKMIEKFGLELNGAKAS